jgi:SAM-dependent methyltransferase
VNDRLALTPALPTLADSAERANPGLHDHVADELVRLAPDRNSRLLDLGCGTGAFLRRLAASGYRHLTGIDIKTPSAADGAIRYIECDLDHPWPIESGAIDLVLAIEAIEHVENVGTMLQEASRVLRPGGCLLLTTPNVHSVEARLRFLLLAQLKQFDALGDPTHVSPLFLFPARRLIERHALALERVWGHPLDGSSPTSRPGLRGLARVLRWMGVRGAPDGDQLCIVLRRQQHAQGHGDASKQQLVTSHYR